MPLDDAIITSSPDATDKNTLKSKVKASMDANKAKIAGKDQILINPDIKQVMQEAAEKHHVLAFGRMNPITSGHEAVVKKIHDVAKDHNAGHTLVVSHSQDAKKNPLSAEQKVKHAHAAFPGTNVKASSKTHPTILHQASELHKQGVKHLHVVAGSDRTEEMDTLLHKYNGHEGKHGSYNFKSITVHSSGERDPDSEGVKGMSASKMREHAAAGNKEKFHSGAPSKMSTKEKDSMYNDVRKGMGLHESVDIIERLVTLQQRRARAIQMRRLQPTLKRTRAISRLRTATEKQLERRAYKNVKQNIRRRFAGARGIEYQTLGPSDKVSVDRMIDPKVKNIKNIVKRVMPRVKQADIKRLQAVRSGKAYRKGSLTQFQSYELDVDQFNKLWEAVFGEQQQKPAKYDNSNLQADVLKLKAHVKNIQGKKPKTVWNPETRKYKVVYEHVDKPELMDLNESFGALYTARDLGIVAEGGFSMHPTVQVSLDEDAASHERAAAIAQSSGKPLKASIHRRIAAALKSGDMTSAKALMSDLQRAD